MNFGKGIWLIVAVAVALVSYSALAVASEHPSEHPSERSAEHPSEHPNKSSSEHPAEHPAGKASVNTDAVVLSKDQIGDAITAYVDEDASLKGGYFLVYDSKADEVLALTLEKVHRDRLSRVDDQVYFACCDFKATNGKIYDLDIFLEGPNMENLEATRITVHKENGEARYTWYEKDGFWKMKPVN